MRRKRKENIIISISTGSGLALPAPFALNSLLMQNVVSNYFSLKFFFIFHGSEVLVSNFWVTFWYFFVLSNWFQPFLFHSSQRIVFLCVLLVNLFSLLPSPLTSLFPSLGASVCGWWQLQVQGERRAARQLLWYKIGMKSGLKDVD